DIRRRRIRRMRLDVVEIEKDRLSGLGCRAIEPGERQRVDRVGAVLLLDRLGWYRWGGPQRAELVEPLRETEAAREQSVGEERAARVAVLVQHFGHADLRVEKPRVELDYPVLRGEPRRQQGRHRRIGPRALRIGVPEDVGAA